MDEQLVTDLHNAIWESTEDRSGSDVVNPAALLNELSRLCYAVVKLPDRADDLTWPVNDTPIYDAKVAIEPDGRIGMNGVGNPVRTAETALSLAAALIAAARHAQGGRS